MATPILNFDATSITTVGFKFKGDEQAIQTDCNGSIAVETETTTISKKCGATTVKEVTKPIKMTVTLTAHVPVEIFRRFYGLKHDATLKEGIYSYGGLSQGEQFSLMAELVDDFEETSKLLAFLNATSQTALTFTIENGADEVAALELAITANKDDLGYWYHEALEDELTDLTKETWLTALTAENMKKTAGE